MKKGMPSWFMLVIGIICAFGVTKADDSAALSAVSASNNEFSAQLYDVIRKSSKDNLIVSPISVSAVMAMLQAGAKGQTAAAIRKSMRFPDNDEQLNSGYRSLLQQMKSTGNYTLEMVNKLFPAEGFHLNQAFQTTLKSYFAAEPQQLNYKQPQAAAKTINDFVSHATHDKIKDLISSTDLDEATRLVLVNAIYFKGTWKKQFSKDDTSKMDFYTAENDTVKVDMMKMESDILFGDFPELDAKCVSLPYEGDRLSMLILLPNQRNGLTAMEDKLKTFPLNNITNRLRERKVQLFLPRFKLESTIDLKEPLTQLGAGAIFGDNADLSGISDTKEKLYVSKAVQKAFIEVNEEGSEAAAATGVAIAARSGISIPVLSFKVNRGFVGIIYDDVVPTSTNIFMTAVDNPTVTETRYRSLIGDIDVNNGPTASSTILSPLFLFTTFNILCSLLAHFRL